jgi:hypothetical protein
MEIVVDDIKKRVEIWLTREEREDVALRESLKEVCAGYKSKKYLVATFESGNQSLFKNTRDLLLVNREKTVGGIATKKPLIS